MLKAAAILLSLGLTLISAFAQTPPSNDNFANRTILTGTNLVFTGTLAGATAEPGEPGPYISGDSRFETVWWEWTAPETTVLNLKLLAPLSNPNGLIYSTEIVAELDVFSTSDANPALSALSSNRVAQVEFVGLYNYPNALCFPVTAGSNYIIQLSGTNVASVQLALIADNHPLIIKQPVSRTVSSNDCALFYVIATDPTPLGNNYQWLFNGTNLPGETAPMLSVTNVDGTMAGNYSAIVSNGLYFTVSQPATLTVSQSNVPISLTATGVISNSLAFNLVGEAGRFYTIQTSTDLSNWDDNSTSPTVGNFPFSFQQLYPITSVVQSTNASTQLLAFQNGPKQFFRALPYVPSDEHSAICINNLNQIYIAKLLWMIENGEFVTGTPVSSDLKPYFPHQVLPACPDDVVATLPTSYNIGDLQTPPACQIIPIKHSLSLVP